MKDIPYACTVGSLMYAQVYTQPDISFVVGMLVRYQSNPGLDYWRGAKKVLRYLQGTKDYMLMNKHHITWKSLATPIQTLLVVLIHGNQLQDTYLC